MLEDLRTSLKARLLLAIAAGGCASAFLHLFGLGPGT